MESTSRLASADNNRDKKEGDLRKRLAEFEQIQAQQLIHNSQTKMLEKTIATISDIFGELEEGELSPDQREQCLKKIEDGLMGLKAMSSHATVSRGENRITQNSRHITQTIRHNQAIINTSRNGNLQIIGSLDDGALQEIVRDSSNSNATRFTQRFGTGRRLDQ